jgi:hypothetical protein
MRLEDRHGCADTWSIPFPPYPAGVFRIGAQLDQPEYPFFFRLTLSPWRCFFLGQKHFGAALDPSRGGAPSATQATSVPAAAGDRDRPANVLLGLNQQSSS